MGTKGSRNINEASFNQIRKLLDMKLTNTQVSELVPFSYATIARISAQPTYAEYKKFLIEKHNARMANKSPETLIKVGKPELTHTVNPLPELNNERRSIMALNRIADNLERLADAWEAQPKRNKFF